MTNSRFPHLAADRLRAKSRTSSKQSIIFGIHVVTEAILAGKQSIAKIWLKQASNHPGHKKIRVLAKKEGIPCSQVPIEKLQRLTKKKHQGVVASLSPIDFSDLAYVLKATYEKGKDPLLLLLDQIQDMRNLGAMVRTAVATQVDALVIGSKHTVPITYDAMVTSAGALAHLAVCRVDSFLNMLTFLQQNGIQIVACTEKANTSIYKVDFQLPTALIVGSEKDGITSKHLAMANIATKIPMLGPVRSLNAATAASIALYEVFRQRYHAL